MARLIKNRPLSRVGAVVALVLLLLEGALLSVEAQAAPGTDTVLVMDVSGSMNDADPSGGRKIDGAERAGLMVVNAIGQENSLGTIIHQAALVTFNETAQVASPLTTDMAALANRVRAMSPGGNTNISDGLDKALTLLEGSAGSTQKVVILLSDGLPTTGLRQEAEFLSGPVARARQLGVCIYTVGLGEGGQMNADLLRTIAEGSGCGKFYLASEAFQLVSAYMLLRHESTGQKTQIWTGVIGQGEEKQLGAYMVEPDQELLDVSLVWPGSKVELVLRDPKNTLVTPTYPGAQVFSGVANQRIIVQKPVAGSWSVAVVGVNVPERSAPFSVAASVRVAPRPIPVTPTPTPTATATATPATPSPTWTPLPTVMRAPSPTPAPMSAGGGSAVGMLLLGAAVIGGVSGAIFLGRRQRAMSSAWLEVAGGPHAGHRIPLRQMPFRIGRALNNDWVLSDETVSRRHAVIYWSGREFFVRDLGSLGGTYVNARPVVDSVLRPGDRLRIGTVDLVFMQGRPYPMNRF